jgi:hypothetical protein
MIDFNYKELIELSSKVQGQTIKRIQINDRGMDTYLEIILQDGRIIKFRYDWIYDFEVEQNIYY